METSLWKASDIIYTTAEWGELANAATHETPQWTLPERYRGKNNAPGTLPQLSDCITMHHFQTWANTMEGHEKAKELKVDILSV